MKHEIRIVNSVDIKLVPTSNTLLCCVLGQDRSVTLSERYGMQFLSGGLKSYDDLLKVSRDLDGCTTSQQRRSAEKEMDITEAKIQSFLQMLLIITPYEQAQYQVVINMFANILPIYIIHSAHVGRIVLSS